MGDSSEAIRYNFLTMRSQAVDLGGRAINQDDGRGWGGDDGCTVGRQWMQLSGGRWSDVEWVRVRNGRGLVSVVSLGSLVSLGFRECYCRN